MKNAIDGVIHSSSHSLPVNYIGKVVRKINPWVENLFSIGALMNAKKARSTLSKTRGLFRHSLLSQVIIWTFIVPLEVYGVVIYDYYELTESTGGYSYSGQIQFSNEAYFAGSISGSIDFFSLCYFIDPDTGDIIIDCEESDIHSVSMFASGGAYGAFSMNWFAPFEFNPFEATIFYDLVFDDLLSGSFFWYDSYITDLAMSGSSVWSVDNSGSDVIQRSCTLNDPSICSGATGMWVLDQSSVPVNEPANFWLFGAGLLLLLLFRTPSPL